MSTHPFDDIAAAHAPPSGPRLSTFTAAELQTIEFPPIRWTVPGILPEGLTLLCGKPKLGKSWLALDIALAVASGGETLGRDVEPGAVLYLAMEDNQRRLKRRLQKIAGPTEWPNRLHMATEAPRLGQGGEAAIKEWAEGNDGARVVFVDTLATVRPVVRMNENAHSSDYAALRGLHGLAGELGLAVVVVHHVRKMGADDVFDTVSGSTGLTGAADSTLILTRREGEGGVVLYGRGRDLEEIEIALEFDKLTCRWRDLGDPSEAFASDTRQAIFAAIRAGKNTPAEIAEAAALTGDNTRQTLRRMVQAGDLRKDGRGVYTLPSDPLSQQSHCHNAADESDNVTDVTPPSWQTDADDPHNPDAWR